MSKLSPKERALLDVARKGWGPSTSVARAVRAGIPRRLREEPGFGMDAPGPGGTVVDGLSPARAFLRKPWALPTGLAVIGMCVAFGAGGVLRERTIEAPPVLTPAPVAQDAPPP